MLNAQIDRLLRQIVALQVAALEFENSELNDTESIKAVKKCYAEIGKTLKAIEKC